MLVCVGENIVLIVSNKFIRPIKLSHDAGESMNDEKKKGFIKNHHIGKCVFC